jgi:hypothetical protein
VSWGVASPSSNDVRAKILTTADFSLEKSNVIGEEGGGRAGL